MNIGKLFPSPFDYSQVPELSDPQYCQTTFCPRTPENWKKFHRLKYLIVSGIAFQANPPSEHQLQEAWKDLEQDSPS